MNELVHIGNADIPGYKGKSVYVFLLSNGIVKIGVSSSVKKRMKQIEKHTKQEVKEWYASAPFVNAYELEKMIHGNYAKSLVSGEHEYFDIPYRNAVDYVKHCGDKYGKMEKVNIEEIRKSATKLISYFHPELKEV